MSGPDSQHCGSWIVHAIGCYWITLLVKTLDVLNVSTETGHLWTKISQASKVHLMLQEVKSFNT